ncbi:DUF1249 domain-containing protein [Massilia sp. erpn]|uniref:DUF1249 domain-containing protein n=1 Tax=Massilia sp. erpn TaxID=2738142 RepID=UPI002105E871|nr:DUF1249 domain-containing protein [Massilia sp. erpn]UTY57393.1 DUF1249 domain-containing protein [Massilia sp. erpn]
MDLYKENYRKLLQLLPVLHDINGPARLTALGYSDVNIDVIERHKHRLVLRMSHYLERLHGSAIPDPDMTVEVFLAAETVGALTYTDCFGSRKVFCPELMAFSPLVKAELNSFLSQWLTKMIDDGREQSQPEQKTTVI